MYAIGRVKDPLIFFQKVRSQQGAITASIPIIASGLREEVARDEQSQIVKTNREDIMSQVDRVGYSPGGQVRHRHRGREGKEDRLPG